MIIHKADRLQIGVHDGWTDERHPSFFKVFGKGLALNCFGRDILDRFAFAVQLLNNASSDLQGGADIGEIG